MPTTANTYSLDDYPQLNITSYRKYLALIQHNSLPVSYNHNGKAYRYNIDLLTTQCNYGGTGTGGRVHRVVSA